MSYVVNFDPVIFSLGPLQIRWYGFMYVVAFLLGGQILKYLAQKNFFPVPLEKAESLVSYLLVGMFFGARLTYVFVYNWEYYQDHWSEILAVWHGGLSFHGAVFGMCLAASIFAKKYHIHFFQVVDPMVLAGTQGLFWGRIGNFINGELFGRVTNSSVGMIFPTGGPSPRHASQLYEAVAEGIILSLVLWLLKGKMKIYGILSGIFLMGYGIMRFIIEFYREPDSQLGLYFGFMTMGQILCVMTFIVGLVFVYYSKKKNIAIKV